MYTITEKQYNALHKDYRGVWDSDVLQGTNWNGKRTLMTWIGGTCLLIEGESVVIVKNEDQNINPYDAPKMKFIQHSDGVIMDKESGILYNKKTLEIVGQENN